MSDNSNNEPNLRVIDTILRMHVESCDKKGKENASTMMRMDRKIDNLIEASHKAEVERGKLELRLTRYVLAAFGSVLLALFPLLVELAFNLLSPQPVPQVIVTTAQGEGDTIILDTQEKK